jgi:hypothetical protein
MSSTWQQPLQIKILLINKLRANWTQEILLVFGPEYFTFQKL